MTKAESGLVDPIASWIEVFGNAIERGAPNELTPLFTHDCFWRDLLAFSWNIVTVEGVYGVQDLAAQTCATVGAAQWVAHESHTDEAGIVEGWFTFETRVARCKGHVRLRDGKCWTLFTSVTELKGYEERRGRNRILGTRHQADRDRKTWLESRETLAATLGYEEEPDCVILGGGQAGVTLAARLGRLGVTALVIDRNERPGDAWRNRYKSLCLHDPVWYDHLPYFPFPDDWPIFTPKDKMADWLELYVRAMELNYWTSADCRAAHYDEQENRWSLDITRDGKPIRVKTPHVVIAMGLLGFPSIPSIAGEEKFQGEQHHSMYHRSSEIYQGKKCIVVGANNSAHDICMSLWENGAQVTMLQRSSTTVIRSKTLLDSTFGLYSEDAVEKGIDVEKADEIFSTFPLKVFTQDQIKVTKQIQDTDAEFYKRLRDVGFKLDFGIDGSGLLVKAFRDGGGYYIDVGASDLIINGDIKVIGYGIDHIKEKSVVLTDDSELEADVIVYATGYKPLNGPLAEIFGEEVAAKIGKCWGMGSGTRSDPGPWEGEERNLWKPTAIKDLWITGGNLALSRYYSRFLAIQIKARLEGIETPVYRQPEAVKQL